MRHGKKLVLHIGKLVYIKQSCRYVDACFILAYVGVLLNLEDGDAMFLCNAA
jgi:hypothetical protein